MRTLFEVRARAGPSTSSAWRTRTDPQPYQRDEIGRTASDGTGPACFEPDREANLVHTAAMRAHLRALPG